MREHNKMKKYFLGLLLLGGALLSSCMTDDDDEVTLSSECYIVSFELESVRQVMHITASDGSDSTYVNNIDGSYFPITIDHRTHTIENRDSLPYNSDVSALLATVTYSGAAMSYRDLGNTSDTAWISYSSEDSIDFTKPLQFAVVAPDATSYRHYTVKLNVHQQEGDSLYWNCSDSIVPPLENMTEMKAVAFRGQLMVLGRTADGVSLALRDGLGGSANWATHSPTLPADAELSTLKVKGEAMYLTSLSGQMYSSADGILWEEFGTPKAGMKLAAVTNQFFYALMDGRLYRSADAVEWTEEELDEDIALLPQSHLQSLNYTQENGNKRLFLAGATGNESASWTKMWRSDKVEDAAMWMYFNPTADNVYPFPLLEDQALFLYDDRLMTFGGKRMDAEGKAMDCLYVSRDNGITWKEDLELHLPTGLEGVEGPLAATVDANHYIWIIANKQVWRGRLNRLGFEQQ